jgi:hypothetical protein
MPSAPLSWSFEVGSKHVVLINKKFKAKRRRFRCNLSQKAPVLVCLERWKGR